MSALPARADHFLLHCFAEGIAAVQPARAMADVTLPPPGGRPWVLAVGKAAAGMADALASQLAERGTPVAGGLAISTVASVPVSAPLLHLVADHPDPGSASAAAADVLAQVIRLIPEDAEVHVALSGGATALMAAPWGELSGDEMRDTFAILHRAGAPILLMNAVRRRVTRWSGGRLADALYPRAVHQWVISDVPGDNLATIGSGPCVGDPWGDRLPDALRTAGLWDLLPAAVQHAVSVPGLPTDHQSIASVTSTLVASNSMAMAAIARAAGALGVPQRVYPNPIEGEARAVGTRIAMDAMRTAKEWALQNQALIEDGHGDAIRPLLLVWGGETTVTRGDSSGKGGRTQELALAAAAMLDISPLPITILAAGSDGRDGPTDAAGAIVDQESWQRLLALGDPSQALAEHNSYPLLHQAGLHLHTGESGTNVMDLVVAVVGWDARGAQEERG